MAHVISADDIDFALYEKVTDAQQHVRSGALYVQALLDALEQPAARERHACMPWQKTRDLIQFRRGEVTVWGGQNGSGKSLVLGQVGLGACAQDEKVCIASFEMKPKKTMERLGRQWTHCDLFDPQVLCDPAERRHVVDLYEQFRDWSDGRLWLYDQQGTVQWQRVCGVIRYAARELGVTQFVVDSLMKCVAGEDDYNGQKAFVDTLCAIARDEDMHIHLVHHIKKPASDENLPGKYDFKGTGAITDQVDNVIGVWRNKKKERDRQARLHVPDTEPDTKLVVDKQRNGTGWEGVIGLWYHAASQQFVPGHQCGPMALYGAGGDEEATSAGA